ncbi:hypothetical protein IWZ01DRAFT_563460 [Phyllosticta capitalensis]
MDRCSMPRAERRRNAAQRSIRSAGPDERKKKLLVDTILRSSSSSTTPPSAANAAAPTNAFTLMVPMAQTSFLSAQGKNTRAIPVSPIWPTARHEVLTDLPPLLMLNAGCGTLSPQSAYSGRCLRPKLSPTSCEAGGCSTVVNSFAITDRPVCFPRLALCTPQLHELQLATAHIRRECPPPVLFFYPISLLVVPPPAPPSRPGTALGQAAATVARTRRRLQGSHATASSPHDTSPACQVLTSCSALSGRHQEFLFHHAASTGHRDHSLRKRLRFFENKSQKHDEAGRPQNVVMRPALGIWHSRLVVVAHVEARDCCDEVNRVGLRLKKHPHVSRHQKEIDARVTRYAMSPARAPSQSRSNGFFPVLMPGNGTRKFSHGWLWRDRGKGKACLA